MCIRKQWLAKSLLCGAQKYSVKRKTTGYKFLLIKYLKKKKVLRITEELVTIKA